jgi:feruloyl esterase
MSRSDSGISFVLLGVLLCWPVARAAGACEDLGKLALANARITAAQDVAAGQYQPVGASGAAGAAAFQGLPAFCRVAATLKPSSDSEIKIEVWLPASGWNGKFQAYGNGGWSGSLRPASLAAGLSRGYATAITDTGHEGSSASFALGHPEKLIDFGYRAVHETAVAAKAIVAAYYSRPARFSYWNGCSAGGRQGLMEAQRFPGDFDGIIAGAPGLHWTGRAIQSIAIAQASHKNEASYIPPAKYPVLHQAALDACDAQDCVKDGVLEDPTRCRFDPQVVACQGADGPGCLTAAQVETARRIYSPTLNPRTKAVLTPGYERGSELGWATMAGPRPFTIGVDLFKYVVFENPDWDYRSLNFDTDIARTEKVAGAILNARDPNLKAFFARGGKLIQYHGWNDPQIAPGFSVDYYKSVLEAMGGASRVQGSLRLFMVPGMAHCGGGQGTSSFDMLAALEQWVEKGQPPASVPAARMRNGKTDRTRPLCPYPQVAVYQGTGSTDDAANFVCRAQ